jgi:predicted small lipoprotein YifL
VRDEPPAARYQEWSVRKAANGIEPTRPLGNVARTEAEYRRAIKKVNLTRDLLWYRSRENPPKVPMKAPILERSVTRVATIRLALFGTLAAALLLSGCGRKGALDPPPGGYALPSDRNNTTPTTDRGISPGQPDYDAQGKPVAPRGPKKRLPGDLLID